jgi:hypothetical protein
MGIRLGGELELKDIDDKASTLNARQIFLDLVWEMKPEAILDLLRLFNYESLSLRLQKSQQLVNFAARLFLLHLKHYKLYSVDLSKYDFKADVRQTPLLAYFEYLFINQTKFEKLLKNSKKFWSDRTNNPQPSLITDKALVDLISDWKTLQSNPDAKSLCALLLQWAEKWNLNEEWCLNFALDVLRRFKTELIDNLSLKMEFLEENSTFGLYEYEEFQDEGSAWKLALFSLKYENAGKKHNYSTQVPKSPEFKFIWTQESKGKRVAIFEIKDNWSPTIFTKESFKKRVENQLWSKFFNYFTKKSDSLVGQISEVSRKLNEFQKRVNKYTSKVESLYKNVAIPSVLKKGGDKHFRWLIKYQIPPVKSYEKLSKENSVTRKAISDAIKGASKIIGLTLRHAQKSGRPKGTKDSHKRRRADSNKP